MDCELGNAFFALMNKVRLLNQKYKNFGELSQAEFCMLMTIGMAMEKEKSEKSAVQGITTTEIVKSLGTSLSAGSKLLRSVEEKGYIERVAHPHDRRVTYILLSEKGDAILKQQEKKRDKMMASIIEKMGKDNMMQLKDLLEQVYEIMKEEMEARQKL